MECSSTSSSASSHGYCEKCAENLHSLGGGRNETEKSKKMRENTYERIKQIEEDENIESVEYMWSCQFQELRRTNREVEDMCERFWPFPKTEKIFNSSSQNEILNKIYENELQGLLFATFKVSDVIREHVDHFPPIFCRQLVKPLGYVPFVLVSCIVSFSY